MSMHTGRRPRLVAAAVITTLVTGLLVVIGLISGQSASALNLRYAESTSASTNSSARLMSMVHYLQSTGLGTKVLLTWHPVTSPPLSGAPTKPTKPPVKPAPPAAPTSSAPSAPTSSAPSAPTAPSSSTASTPAAAGPPSVPAPPHTPTLIWSDEFNGSAGSAPDSSKWAPNVGGSGWGNQELECYTNSPDNESLNGDGQLVLTARYQPNHKCSDGNTNDYTSGKLTTYDLASMKYGSIRVRAKLPSASGMWPAIWALGTDNYSAGWPQSGEMDIAEVVGQSPSTVYSTLHGPATAGGAYGIGGEDDLSSPVSDAYHVYGADWTANSISFSIDGKTYATFTKAQIQKSGSWEFDKPFFLVLNLAVGGTWPGTPKANSVFPQQMLVDYVRLYQ